MTGMKIFYRGFHLIAIEVAFLNPGYAIIDRHKFHIIHPDRMVGRIIKSYLFCPIDPRIIVWINLFF